MGDCPAIHSSKQSKPATMVRQFGKKLSKFWKPRNNKPQDFESPAFMPPLENAKTGQLRLPPRKTIPKKPTRGRPRKTSDPNIVLKPGERPPVTSTAWITNAIFRGLQQKMLGAKPGLVKLEKSPREGSNQSEKIVGLPSPIKSESVPEQPVTPFKGNVSPEASVDLPEESQHKTETTVFRAELTT